MNSAKTKGWHKRDYINFFLGLMAPVLLYYLIVVVPAVVFNSNDCDCETTDENTWIEDVVPGELFIFAGLFTYPAVMVLYFLYRGEIGNERKSFEQDRENFSADLEELRGEIDNLRGEKRDMPEGQDKDVDL